MRPIGAVPSRCGIMRNTASCPKPSSDVRDIIEISPKNKGLDKPAKRLSRAERQQRIEQLTREMKNAAKLLEFEHAAWLRDEIDKLRKMD